jgi:hypothetical protein
MWQHRSVRMLRYVELKSGHSDNGPAWIGYVTPSKTSRTIYFNGRALLKLKGQRRGEAGGNYCDMDTASRFGYLALRKTARIVIGPDLAKSWSKRQQFPITYRRSARVLLIPHVARCVTPSLRPI